ncbi:MAG: TonB family protein, partial [Sphingomonadales bacterium]|nr:TonB family protein [Sphingomonadales bacterium]
ATHERIYGPGHSELVEPTVELAETLSLARRFNSAMRKFEDALTLIERAHGKAHPLYADVLLRMGETMLVRLKPRKAELYAMAALELSYSLSPSHEPTIVAAHGQLARIQSEIGNYEKTIHHAREAAHANARARGGTSEPLPLHRPLPTGSKLYDGYVRIELTVADDGSTKKVKILEGQPMNTFDLAVRKAVAKWRFAPAMKNGKFVESKPIVTVINFVKSARCVWLTGAPNSDENGVDVLTKCTWTHDRPEAFGRTSVISNDNNR